MKKKSLYFSVHYSFVLLMFSSLLLNVLNLVIYYFLFLVLHEMVHSFVARKLGYKIGKIKLLATGAVLEAESDEFGFSDEIKIAVSAPLFNLVIALLFVVSWWVVPESYNYTLDLFVINLAIFAFNMLPIFPLDGGRVLLAYLSKKYERSKAVKTTRVIAVLFSLLLFCIFIVTLFFTPNFNFGIVAISLFVGGISEDKNAVYKKSFYFSRKYERAKSKGVEIRKIYISEDFKKAKLYKLLDARFYTVFIVVDKDMNEIGVIKEKDIVLN